jgi:hypothetical protein
MTNDQVRLSKKVFQVNNIEESLLVNPFQHQTHHYQTP